MHDYVMDNKLRRMRESCDCYFIFVGKHFRPFCPFMVLGHIDLGAN